MEKDSLVWKIYFFVVLVAMLNVTASKKILMLSPSVGSHLMQMNSIAEGLLDRGHTVFAIFHSRAMVDKSILNSNVKVIKYDTGVEPIFQNREYQEHLLAPESLDLGFFEKMNSLKMMFEMFTNQCRNDVTNAELFKKLQAEHFDFIVVDGVMKCHTLIANNLGVPFASFMAFLPPDIPHAALQSPILLPGPIDEIILGSDIPPLFAKIIKISFVAMFFNAMDVFGDISNITLYELQKQSKLFLFDVSKVLGTPMPVSPNVINVGGLNVRQPKALPEGELKQFIDSASDGFILVSFGSFAKYFSDKIIRVLLDTFKSVPFKVIWKWDRKSLKENQTLPLNVLAMKWVPQNDVLGHENIKLFVTHCGNSGQHEALYNSVPMVGIPLFGDQMFNAKRVEGRFGRHIRLRDLTKDKLLDLISSVISNRQYADNIGKASAIFRDQSMEPRETAAYWIDHVIKYGADHLSSKTNEMSWIQILMWDILFVVCAIGFVVTALLFLLCRCLLKKCFSSKKSATKMKQS